MKPKILLSLALVLSACTTSQRPDSAVVDATCTPHGVVLSDHTLYGATSAGEVFVSDGGALFKVNPDGTGFAVLHDFTQFPNDGARPIAALVVSRGTLYGTAAEGGSANCGTVFKVKTNGKDFRVLHSFQGIDGGRPMAALVLSGQSLYGTTEGGGVGEGTVFKVNVDGTGFGTLHTFTAVRGARYTNSDGRFPQSELVLSGQTLYGTAWSGGPAGQGTVFKVNTDGTGFVVLHGFGAGSANAYNFGRLTGMSSNSDGGWLESGLVLSGTTLYGTASQGGAYGRGTIFKLNTNGTDFTVLHTFTEIGARLNSDGGHPGPLVASGNVLYGTTSEGGAGGWGTLFRVGMDGAGFTTLPGFTKREGAGPVTGMMRSGDALFGTTGFGGPGAGGIVFTFSTNGTGLSILHSFVEKPLPGVLTD
ncbi:MAG: choice-of-anchor tandem repeat GloVer-containing protein [Verrucomicrobiota bacterium]